MKICINAKEQMKSISVYDARKLTESESVTVMKRPGRAVPVGMSSGIDTVYDDLSNVGGLSLMSSTVIRTVVTAVVRGSSPRRGGVTEPLITSLA